ncbi:MAG: hypothetical protein ACI97A_002325, partial [Planctomycetota bacterium]
YSEKEDCHQEKSGQQVKEEDDQEEGND